MSVFEIEGVAKRELVCDVANIEITFRASGKNAFELSSKVMDQCDSFLKPDVFYPIPAGCRSMNLDN